MDSKIFLLSFIFVLKFSLIFSQSENLKCHYHSGSFGYTCVLEINNPNGLNNFVSINGVHLPGFSDQDVVSLGIYEIANSPNIPAIICQKFQNIRNFDLDKSTFQRIDDYSFSDCTLLTRLNLQESEFNTISERAFVRNVALYELHMNHNQITMLPENLFQNQINIDFMFFGSNRITDLPKNLFRNVSKLRHWDFRFNQIRNLRNEWFENLQNVQFVYLHYNNIADLPRNIFNRLTSVQLISLYGNYLKTIHADSFGFLPTLSRLDLFFNQINAIDENLIDNTGINLIDLTGNLCANRHVYDPSATRALMRSELVQCIINYDSIISGKLIFLGQW